MVPDHFDSNAYLTSAYQLDLWNLLHAGFTHTLATLGRYVCDPGHGVNVNFSPAVQLKNMAAPIIETDAVGEDTRPEGDNGFATVASRLGLAF